MRVAFLGSSTTSPAAAALSHLSSSAAASSSLRRFHGNTNHLRGGSWSRAAPRPVSMVGRGDVLSTPPAIIVRASSSSLPSLNLFLGGLGSRTTTPSRVSLRPLSSSSRLHQLAPRQPRRHGGARSDATQGVTRALATTTTTLSKHLNNNGKSSSGGQFFLLPHSSLGLWRPTGAVLAKSYSSSPFGGGGSGRGSGGGGGNRWAAGGVGLIGAASVLLGKSKYLLGALKLTKLASLGSMVFTVGTYSMFFGLLYAAGMVGLILVHETGHALVMRQRGVDFSPMVFVPFVGAFIAMRNQPRDAYEDALIAFGGPVMGGAGAGAVALAAAATQSQLLFALADFGFMINLFNLLPIGAMDGGRIASALSPYAGVAGLGLGGMLAYSGAVHNPIFYLILLAGGWETFQRFYNPASTPPNYYRITPLQRATLTTSYFGLVAALMAGMAWNHRYQKPPEVLMRERQRELSWDMR